MPEIKNTFVGGRMNKDLDERIIPKGEYRDAMNIQIGTSEGSDIGTVQNILGNLSVENIVPDKCKCVGAVADEKNNKLYWFVKREYSPDHINFEAIIEYSSELGPVPILVDTKINTADAVLKFPDKIITGINIIDNLLFWTDGVNEPRKINIDQCKKGSVDLQTHTQLSNDFGSFDGLTINTVSLFQDDNGGNLGSMVTTLDDPQVTSGRYMYFEKDQFDKLFDHEVVHTTPLLGTADHVNDGGSDEDTVEGNIHPLRQYRDGEFLGLIHVRVWNSGGGNGMHARRTNYDAPATWFDKNRTFKIGDIVFGNNITRDIKEENITVIRKSPSTRLNIKINTTQNKNKEPLFEKIFPRFSYRYKYNDNEYSTFAPFTDVVFNPEHKENFSLDSSYDVKEPYNTSMLNVIDSIELTDFINPDIDENVKQIDILYKKEDSPVIYSIVSLKREDKEWYEFGSGQQNDVGYVNDPLPGGLIGNGKPGVFGGLFRGKYIVNSENISNALPENQLLRPWDAVPRKALAQEITGNRIVYGNYVQGYKLDTVIPSLLADYKPRTTYSLPNSNFDSSALPSIKSQRNYQLGVVFGDKYGRETPVFTSSKSAVSIPWRSNRGTLTATQANQIEVKLEKDPPNFAEYIKYFIKETSGEYYNLIMDKVYVPANITPEETKHHLWISFPSSERNKIDEDDYLILKKKIGSGETQMQDKNKFKVLDISNEAPEAVKYEYGLLAELDQSSDNTTTYLSSLFNNSIGHLKEGNTLIMINKEEFHSLSAVRFGFGDGDREGKNYLIDNLYLSWFRVTGTDAGLTSDKYKVIDILTSNDNYIFTLDKPISEKDAVISNQGTGGSSTEWANCGVRFEKRKERESELLSGKFFVKVVSEPVVYGDILDDTSLLNKFVWTSRRTAYWSADAINSTDFHADDGIINAYTYTAPTGGTDSPEQVHSAKVTANQANWQGVIDDMGDGSSDVFFIDNMFMVAGQISDNNYAKNSGQIWTGNLETHQKEAVWVGRSLDVLFSMAPNSNPDDTSIASIQYHSGTSDWSQSTGFGWKFFNRTIPYKSATNSILRTQDVNGLEGIIETQDMHVGNYDLDSLNNLGYGSGIRRWRTELTPGAGMAGSENNLDYTYGKETGKFYMHLSFLAPGEDLVTDTSGIGDSLTGTNSIGKGLQGIWGGGLIGSNDGDVFSHHHRVIPMEGKYPIDENDDGSEPPGPGVPNSFGYDERYRARHENQWNPCWPSDPEGKIREFIDNIKPGSKFKFELDTSNTIYTIKKVSIKKLYNHTPWKYRRMWNGTNGNNDNIANASVWNKGNVWANTLDDAGTSGDATKLTAFKDAIVRFGKANNRRLCYIIELDKNPRDNTTFNPMDGTSMDLDTGSSIQFLAQASSFIELDAEKPIIWETEAKKSADIEIYHEASDPIPTKITAKTNEIFAPVGCYVENLGKENMGDPFYQVNQSSRSVLKRWIDDTTFEIIPGFKYGVFGVSPTEEVDYSNYKFKFIRKDGSYTVGRLAAQQSDPGNSFGFGTGSTRTIFTISSDVGSNLEAGLSWYNCFSFGNGLESNRIQDGFNEMQITNGPVVSSTIDTDYTEEKRTSGLIYSGLYNSNNGINNLNQFITAEKITKDLNPTYGSIQKLYQRRVGLVAFCEDRIVDIVAGKDTLFNADGNPQLVASNKVLGTATPFVGDFGISQNPESFASESYRAYFTDKQRGAVLRLSMDGLTPISDIGMTDWFRDNLITPNELIGTYDEYKKEYNLTLKSDFSENLLRNSNISEGEDLINLTTAPVNLIDNANPNNYTPLVTPDFNTSDSVNNMMSYNQRHFPQETVITQHAAIPEGHYQAAVDEDPSWGYSAATFGITTATGGVVVKNHFNDDDVYRQHTASGPATTHEGGPFAYAPDSSNDGIGAVQKSTYKWGRRIYQSSNWITPNPHSYPHGKGPSFYTTQQGGGTGYKHDYHREASNWLSTSSDYHFIGSANNNGATEPREGGLAWASCTTGDKVVIPLAHTNPISGGVSTDTENWYTDTENNLFFPNPHDFQVFPGEIIEISFIVHLPKQNISPNTIEPYIIIKDGNTTVSDMYFIDHDGDGNCTNGTCNNTYHNTVYNENQNGVSFPDQSTVDQLISWGEPYYPSGINSDDYPDVPATSYDDLISSFTVSSDTEKITSSTHKFAAGYYSSSTAKTLIRKGKFKILKPYGSTVFDGGPRVLPAIHDLKVELYFKRPSTGGGQHYFDLMVTDFQIRKSKRLTKPENRGYIGNPAFPAIPSADVPAWTQIENRLKQDNWTFTGVDTLYSADKFLCNQGIVKFGSTNPPTYDSATAIDGTTYTWPTPTTQPTLSGSSLIQGPSVDGNNILSDLVGFGGATFTETDSDASSNVTYLNGGGPGIVDTQLVYDHGSEGDIYINTTSTGTGASAGGILVDANFDSQASMDPIQTADKWLMVDVITKPLSGTVVNGGINSTGILVRGLIDPAVTSTNANTGPYWGTDFFASSLPYGTFGSANQYSTGNPTVGTDRGLILLRPTDFPLYNNMHGGNLLGIQSHGYLGSVPTGYQLFRAVVKVNANSYTDYNDINMFKMQFYNFEGLVKLINVRDISEVQTGGVPTNWDWDDVDGNMQTNQWQTATPPTSWNHPEYGGGDGALVVNSIHRKRMYVENGKFKFRDATGPGQVLYQSFTNDHTAPFDLLPAQDNYEFSVKIENHSGDIVLFSLRTKLFMDTDTKGYNLRMFFDQDGEYKVTFNFTEGNPLITSIERNGVSYTPNTAAEIIEHSWVGGQNSLRIHNLNYYKSSFPTVAPIPVTCDISQIKLVDASNIIIGGSVDFWEFVGFDPTDDDYIYFDNEEIVLNSAPDYTEIRQVINKHVALDSKYRIRFNANITDGQIRAYYFNSNGDGFVTPIIDNTNSGYYDSIHIIGEEISSSGNVSNPIKNTFVIEIIDGEGNVTGTLDNFSMQRVVEFSPQTLSFSEKTKGWISFKSFTPENGVSLAKQYYTMNDGRLFQHHANQTRNQFYNQAIHELPESSITMILNQEPSLIKTFNTLNYEGTQSQIYRYDNNHVEDTIETYNTTVSAEAALRFPYPTFDPSPYAKLGWYVNSIETDKQIGNIKEFVEKEGKWFNYIKGSNSSSIDTGELSFQGLGVAINVTVSSGSSTTSGGGSGDDNGGNGGNGGNGTY